MQSVSEEGQMETREEVKIYFRDELHVSILNTVVDHLDEVARASGTDVVAARRAVLNLMP